MQPPKGRRLAALPELWPRRSTSGPSVLASSSHRRVAAPPLRAAVEASSLRSTRASALTHLRAPSGPFAPAPCSHRRVAALPLRPSIGLSAAPWDPLRRPHAAAEGSPPRRYVQPSKCRRFAPPRGRGRPMRTCYADKELRSPTGSNAEPGLKSPVSNEPGPKFETPIKKIILILFWNKK